MYNAVKAVWRYISKHHEECGVALFVVPVLFVVFALISIGYGLIWMVR